MLAFTIAVLNVWSFTEIPEPSVTSPAKSFRKVGKLARSTVAAFVDRLRPFCKAQFLMDLRMVIPANYHQVFNPVVALDSIDVMDDFIRSQFSSNLEFNYFSMLSYVFPSLLVAPNHVSAGERVGIFRYMPMMIYPDIVSVSAFHRTKSSPASPYSGSETFKFNSTLDALSNVRRVEFFAHNLAILSNVRYL